MVPWGDWVYTKETQYVLEGPFLDAFRPPEVQGDAVVDWWVRVVHKTGETQDGKPIGIDISLPSDKWALIVAPKPEGK